MMNQALAVVAVVAMAGGLAGVSEGWAFADDTIGPSGSGSGGWAPSAPGLTIALELGWWNSSTHIQSGWAPVVIDMSGEAARSLGTVTAVILGLSAVAAMYMLSLALCDVFRLSVPQNLRAAPTIQQKAAGLFGVLSLILTVVLYLGLMFGAHSKIKEKFGDNANVWPRPDWASGSALLGSISLLLLAKRLAPTSYEPVGYMPI